MASTRLLLYCTIHRDIKMGYGLKQSLQMATWLLRGYYYTVQYTEILQWDVHNGLKELLQIATVLLTGFVRYIEDNSIWTVV